MPVDTRNTQYSLPDLPCDTDMEDEELPLALPAIHEETQLESPPRQAVQPTQHNPPTSISASTPTGDLMALIESIPAPVHIEKVVFSV
jgi:hypothetical protein